VRVEIEFETLAGLKNAYIAWLTLPVTGSSPRDRLESWIDAVLEEADMLGEVQRAVQKRHKEDKDLRDAFKELQQAMSRATSGNTND
jgi:hypothetical protein